MTRMPHKTLSPINIDKTAKDNILAVSNESIDVVTIDSIAHEPAHAQVDDQPSKYSIRPSLISMMSIAMIRQFNKGAALSDTEDKFQGNSEPPKVALNSPEISIPDYVDQGKYSKPYATRDVIPPRLKRRLI